MRKTMLILSIIMFIMLGSSCDKYIDPDIEGEKKCKELLEYLSDKDEEGLKSMFCEKTASSSAFDKEIKMAISNFEGNVTTYDILINSGRSVEEGKTILLDITAQISDIVTDAEKKYEIVITSYLINSEHEDKVGISELSIKSKDGKECIVGKYIR